MNVGDCQYEVGAFIIFVSDVHCSWFITVDFSVLSKASGLAVDQKRGYAMLFFWVFLKS